MRIRSVFELRRNGKRGSPTHCTNSSATDGPWRRFEVVLLGCAALLWLILRSGSKPTRLSYPCQQSAFGLAAGFLGAPFVAAIVHGRARLTPRRRAVGAVAMLALVAVVTAATLFPSSPDPASIGPLQITLPPDYQPDVFSVRHARGPSAGRFGGVDDLVTLMGTSGVKWYRSAVEDLRSGSIGLIDPDDVVLIKINAQWAERGGTNTDVLRGLIGVVVEHPDGFIGEVVVADNGQSYGSLNRSLNNAEDTGQSVLDVVNEIRAEGWNVSAQLWDSLRTSQVKEFAEGDSRNGYVVNNTLDAETQIKVSYPKFQTAFGTYVSYKLGIWSPDQGSYDPSKLVVINVPVLKTHSIYGITAGVKNHMGVVTSGISTDSHNGVGRGGLGSVMAEVRVPDLTVLDCIWVLARPGTGPAASYAAATRRDQLLAAFDPVALDAWAAKHILLPEIVRNGYTVDDYVQTQDPDNPDSVFRRYLDRSLAELQRADIPSSNDPADVQLHVWAGDHDADGDVDAIDTIGLAQCLTGPGTIMQPSCQAFDSDDDEDVDLLDASRFQRVFGGPQL